MRFLAFRLWVATNSKWLLPFAAVAAQALRPVFLGGHYTPHEWLGVAGLILAAFVAGVVPNIEAGIGVYAKAVAALAVAGVSAAYNVAPGGWTRGDTWTVSAAVGAVFLTWVVPTTQPRSVLASGDHYLGDRALIA